MLEKYTDIELLQELVKRNGSHDAPKKTVRVDKFLSCIVGLGNDDIAEITYPKDCSDRFGLK